MPTTSTRVETCATARGYAPENTLPGFELALALGVDTLELDVGVTRDGVVVIHHDRRLNPDVARGPDGRWVAPPAPTLFSLSYQELMQFDVGRDPNPHLAFGQGIHFCLGANLARLEIRVVFEELLPAFRSFELDGPVEWTRSNRHTGIRHLPLRLRRA